MASTAVHLKGSLTAVLAALAFGLTTPLISQAGASASPSAVACLLYLGAVAASLVLAPLVRRSGPRPGLAQAPRLLLMGLVGAALAPTLLAWGIAQTGPVTSALALTFEGLFSILLARLAFHEAIGGRAALAIAFTFAGGLLFAWGGRAEAAAVSWGLLAVVAATLCWAVDNTLSRPLADFEPGWVVVGKGLVGAGLTAALTALTGGAWPGTPSALLLLACGATGYGLSLRLYLVAQRHLGAGRTASIFGFAPLAGALLGWALGASAGGAFTLVGAAAFTVGIVLHATEHHGHPHEHPAQTHTHAHRHDDGHHGHSHEQPVQGEHSHPHHHEHLVHEHEHPPDLHHTHAHPH